MSPTPGQIRIKENFQGQRMATVPPVLLSQIENNPLTSGLFLKKIGYFPEAKYHHVVKDSGCAYALLIYCTKGRGWCNIHGKTVELDENHYFIIPPDTPYSFGADNTDPWTIYWLHFCGQSMPGLVPLFPKQPTEIAPGEFSRIHDRIALFEEMFTALGESADMPQMHYVSMCLNYFLGSLIYVGQYRHNTRRKMEAQSFAAKVTRYMTENIGRNPLLEEMARHFAYSPSHFSLLVRSHTGQAPMALFGKLKVEQACFYLEFTSLKISEIAAKTGFRDSSYFIRQFKKTTGTTPKVFRASTQRPE